MADGDTQVEDRTVRLQVAAARQEESGQGIARMSRESLASIGAMEGDVLEITGKSVTVARAVLAYPEDESLAVIRLDGLQRGNAEVGSGDHVTVRKAESRPAQRVVFAPGQKDMRLQGPTIALKRNFFARPMVQGDLVATTDVLTAVGASSPAATMKATAASQVRKPLKSGRGNRWT